jgi:prevent-host-death family protein
MQKAPQVEPISNLQREHTSILRMLGNGPVFLSQRGTLAAVLISIDEWSWIVERVESLADQVDVLEAKVEFLHSGEQLEAFEADEFPALADVQASPRSAG